MTLGRTSENKIKIKTDTPKGLRAVECGCCGNCSFGAFSTTPIEGAEKFKYLTYETTINHSTPGFNSTLESWYMECAPSGTNEQGETEYTCGYFGATQKIQSESLFLRNTMRLKAGQWGCVCDVVKAAGSGSFYYHEIGAGTMGEGWFYFADEGISFSRSSVDAIWSTVEQGEIFLVEKISEPKWAFSDGGQLPIVCFERSGAEFSQESYPYTYSSPLESGGYRVQERTVAYEHVYYSGGGYNNPAIVVQLPSHHRWTLHNTLKEIWGPNQLEMRP